MRRIRPGEGREVWHMSSGYNPEGWTVYCRSEWQPGDFRTFTIADVTCTACRAKAREIGVKGA